MNIQHPTKQANRPETGVVADKGVPQSDSFAKYAAVDSIDQCNNYVKTCSCGGSLDETYIYSKRKSACFRPVEEWNRLK
ncbi:transposase [Salmonella enterica subsp. enterica serovar Oranienburg]|nr:transposase [Salmonella enterica subsp. enterica serovar Oranienburg]